VKSASQEDRYRLNDPSVVSDIIDGEAIIMNMATGHYYSLVGSGANLWRLIVDGFTLAEIAHAMAGHYGIERLQAEADVRDLVARLLTEQLIVSTSAGPKHELIAMAVADGAYEPPVLDVYSDMTNLLALDPPMPQYKADPTK